jgi:hypothetical protein
MGMRLDLRHPNRIHTTRGTALGHLRSFLGELDPQDDQTLMIVKLQPSLNELTAVDPTANPKIVSSRAVWKPNGKAVCELWQKLRRSCAKSSTARWRL